MTMKNDEENPIVPSHVPGWLGFAGFFGYPTIMFSLLPITGYKKDTNHFMVDVNEIMLGVFLFSMLVLWRLSNLIRPENKEDGIIRYYVSYFLDALGLFGYGAGLPAMFLMLILW